MGVEVVLNKKIVFTLIVFVSLLTASAVFATDNVTVNDTLDANPVTSNSFKNLNDAINGNDDTNIELHENYTFDLSNDYNFTEGVVINRSVNIFGNGITIDAKNQARIFNITAENVFIKDINFINARSDIGGAIIGQNYGVISCNFSNNVATKSGGAISGGTATFCNFYNNSARDGGAMNRGSAINSTFTSNRARYGGSLYYTYAENSTFISNYASDYSGAMESSSALGCTFINNRAESLYGAGSFYAVNCTFTNNRASKAGALGGDAVNCKFIGNSADEGGAVCPNGYIFNCTFYSNYASTGGAVSGDGQSIEKCTFYNNSADNYGGALYKVYAVNCKFNGNVARLGGAIYDGSANGCDFVENYASDSYGAIMGHAVGCIFTMNSAKNDGGALGFGSAKNCVFQSNKANRGGAIISSSAINCTLKFNEAREGGAMYGGSAIDCDFISNRAVLGGGIAGSCSAIGSNFTDNYASQSGGANYESSIVNCYLSGNLPKYKLSVSNFEAIYGFGGEIKVKLSDSANTFVNGVKTTLKIYDSNNRLVETGSCLSGYSYYVNLDIGKYSVVASVDDENYDADDVRSTISIKKLTSIYVVAVTATYNINKPLIVNLHDSNGFVLKNTPISITLNGATKNYKTNNNGQILVATTTLAPKTYTVKMKFAGDSKYMSSSATSKITVKKANPYLIVSKMSYYAKEKVKKFYAILKNNVYKVMKNTKLTLKVNGKTYTAKTNSKGRVTFKITKLNKKGTYKAVVTYKGNSYYNKISNSAKITVKK